MNYFPISIRINADTENMPLAEKLLQILYDEGLSGKLQVYLGQIVGVDDGAPSPSADYRPRCFTNAEFARAELEFDTLRTKYGFGSLTLPRPSGAPCTAVRKNEIVVGSAGELYKCWDSVGNKSHVTGSIFDYDNPNGRVRRWLEYNPFTDEDCRSCIALPVCMGGCAHHSMDVLQHENRCSTFRHTYQEQVMSFVEHAEQDRILPPTAPTPRQVGTPATATMLPIVEIRTGKSS